MQTSGILVWMLLERQPPENISACVGSGLGFALSLQGGLCAMGAVERLRVATPTPVMSRHLNLKFRLYCFVDVHASKPGLVGVHDDGMETGRTSRSLEKKQLREWTWVG